MGFIPMTSHNLILKVCEISSLCGLHEQRQDSGLKNLFMLWVPHVFPLEIPYLHSSFFIPKN